MKRLPYFRGLVEQYFSSLSEKQRTVFLFSGILLFAVLASLVFTSWKFFSPSSINKQSPDVLAAKDNPQTLTGEITFNVPAIFKEKVTIDGELVVNGKTLFNENVRLNNKDLDLGTGSISASNIIYSLKAGPNISITGGQNPTISASLSGVVTSLQGQTGAVAFTQGTGIGINGLTITNTDPGSAQNIFKTIDVDGSSITAGSNNDTLELSAGTGISLTTDGNKVTITNSAPDSGSSGGGTVPTDMTPNGILYAETNSTFTSLTPGTTGYILQSNGAGNPPSWVANTSSNPPFSSITSGTNTSAAMVVGAGASLTYAGGTATSGGINANELLGGTWATPGGIGSTTANTGAFTSLSASGTVTFSGLTTGILHSNGSGVVSSSAVNLATGDVTGTLGIANGGTGLTATPTNGQLFIGNGTGYTLATLTAGAGISINNGAGAITIAASGGSGGSQWVEDANGTFYPVNSGLDVILGGTSTSSAKFGFININAGTPTASISAGSSAVYLAGDGTLQTTNNRQLSIGGNTTGDILLSPRNGAGTVTSTGTVNLAAGKTYQIGGIDVLSATTLGSGVVNSSLTGVGALNSGSIASGFGTIATANTITGTTINGTTGINTGAGAGTQRIDASGNLVNIGTVTAGGLITANGGLTVANGQNTTLSSFTTNNNSVLYTNGAGVVNAATTATPGQCLVSNANTPAWATCPGASATNYWQLNNGAISPFSNTLDVLVGATATSSAKFGVLNVNSGTPTASLSAGAAGGTYLAANGLLQTTVNQTLTIGGNTTGNIILSPQNGAGTVMSTGTINLATGKTYQINGTDVLSGTTLGSGVINSSLTSVGALTSGSIASGFGTIATANTITGTTLNGTTGINSGAGAGTQRIDASGNLVNIGTIDSTYLDAAANTVNLAASTALQFNGTTVIDATRNLSNIAGVSTSLNPTAANTYNLGTGTGNQYNSIYGNTVFQNGNQVCDTSGNCAGGAGGSKWQVNAGVLAPLTTTNLLVLGGNTSTAFQFEVNGKQTGKALVSLNETGNQDILTASASGTTVFNINRNGNLQFTGNTAALNTLTSAATTARTYTFPDSTGTICLVEAGNCAGSGGGITGSGTAGQIAFFNTGGSITSETSGFAWDATNNKLGIGIDSPEGKFQVNGASTGKALAILNETGDQNILTASASGVSVFNLDRLGNLAVEGQLSDLSGTALTVNDNLNLITGNAYQINGTNVLSSTTLGTGVTGSSLTSVGTLTAGTWNATAIGAQYGGTGLNTAASTGVPTISSGTWSVSAALSAALGGTGDDTSATTGVPYIAAGNWQYEAQLNPARGGTGVNGSTAANGQLLIGNGAGFSLANITAGSGISINNGSGSITISQTGSGSSKWTEGAGFLTPNNNTLDILVGGTATSSAKFGVLNMAGGTPTASLSAGAAGGSYLTANGTLQTTANQTLTLGGNTTGNIILSPQNGSGTVMSTGSVNLASGKTYQINGTDVLSGTTLGTGVVNSSLTSVGALTSGSIASGFGTIATANTITGTTINGTTGINTGGGAGTQRIDASGNLTNIGTITAGGLITANAGASITAGQNLTLAGITGNNAALYATSGTGVVAGATTNSQNLCLVSGVSAPSWQSCALGASTNFWNSSNGALYPGNSTLDLLVGATATSSAKFGFLNVAGGTPTASISANSGANATYLTGNGTLGTTNGQTLSLGSASTGNVALTPGGTPILTAMSNGKVGIGTTTPGATLDIQDTSTTAPSLRLFEATANEVPILELAGFAGTDDLPYAQLKFTNSNNTVNVANIKVLRTNNSSAGDLTFETSPDFTGVAERMRISRLGNVGIGNIAPVGLLDVQGKVTGKALTILNETGNQNILTASASGTTKFTITNTGNLDFAGNTNFLSTLTSAATAARTWTMPDASGTVCLQNSTSCGFSLGNNLWSSSNGALYPGNSTLDLLLGGTATSSAKFGLLNVAGGTPTASISANSGANATYITGAGTVGTTNAQTLTLGSASTGSVLLAPGGTTSLTAFANGNIGIGETNPLAKLHITGGELWTFNNGNNPRMLLGDTTVSGQYGYLQWDSTNDYLRIEKNGSNGLKINDNFLTIGNIFPSQPLIVANGTTELMRVNTLGQVGINAASPLATLDVRGTSGTTPVASFSGQTSSAGVIVDNKGTGDLLAASSSGLSRFVVTQTGNLQIAGNTNFLSTLTSAATAARTWTLPDASGTICLQNSTSCGFSVGTNLWNSSNGALYPSNSTLDLLVGATATTSAKFGLLNVAGGTPVASISANSGANATYLTGDGTLGTTNRANLTIGNSATYNTSGNVLINPNQQGRLGIGTTNPMTNFHLVASGTTVPTLSASNIAVFQRSSANNTSAGISVLGGNTSTGNFMYFSDTDAEDAGGLQYNHSTDALALRAGGANQLTIDGSGSRNHFFANNGNHTLNIQTVSSNIAGRQLTLRAGDAGAGASDVAGGLFLLQGGAGAGTNGAGGALRLMGGVPAGAGAYGVISLAHDGTNGRGLVGVGTNSPLATLDVRANSGTLPVASVAGQTSNAALIVDNSGVGDLFTASKSGRSKFVITNGGDLRIDGNQTIDTLTAGTLGLGTANATTLTLGRSGQNIVMPTFTNNGGLLYTNGTGTVAQTAVGGSGQCLQSVGGGTPIWSSCGGSSTQWDLKNGALSPSFASTVDLLLGGVSSSSAKFGVLNINSGTPTASVSATSTGAGLALAGDGTIQSLRNNTLVIGGNTTGDIQFKPGNSSSSMYLASSGNVGVGTTLPTAKLHISGTGTLFSAQNANSSFYTDALGVSIDRDSATCGSEYKLLNQGTAYWKMRNSTNGCANMGTLYFVNQNSSEILSLSQTGTLGLNTGTANPLATFDVRGNSGTTPVASVSGNTSFASMVVNNSGSGDIFTASSSGLNRFVIAQNGDVGIGKRPALDSSPTGATITSTGSAQFTSLSGAGLTDCNSSTSKLLWDEATKKFSCGTDRGSVQIRKSANETVTSSTTMQNDDELTFAVAANETWVFRIALVSNTPATPKIKYQITAPSGASCDISTLSGTLGTAGSDGAHLGCSVSISYGGTGGNSITEIYGSVANGANAGSITLQWAQDTSSGTGTTVFAGSSLFGFKTTGADVAEAYFTKDSSIEPGTVVMVDGSLKAGVQKTNKAYDSRTLGIISTKPGIVLGDDTPPEGKPVLLALNGRVPVQIASNSPAIQPGDLLTSANESGKAMKATRAGATIGKALEAWDPASGKKTIMAFVNLSSYDPDVELTDTGDLNIAADPEDMAVPFKLKDAKGEEISRVGRFSQAAIANLSAGVVNAQKFLLNGVDIFDLIGKPTTPASSSALSENMQLKINNLDTRLGGVEKLASQSAADISFLKDAMQQGTLGVSSESAALQSVLGTLDIKDATVSGSLNVLGRATVNDLGVTGNFTAGVLAINGLDDDGQAALNTTAGDLKIQSTGAGGVDFLAGKITIDKKGNMNIKESLTAKVVNTTKLNIIEDTESTTSAVLSTSAGSVVIEKGETSIEVNTKALTTKSLIFATPDQPVAVGTKPKDKDTFIIKLQQPLSADLKVNWWIVN